MRSSDPSRRRTRRLAAAAAVAALAVAVAGCSTTGNNASGGTGASSKPLPGVTKSTVNIGFTIVDLGKLQQQLGFKSPDYGGVATQTKDINAVVSYINQNGGMGGRQVTATINTYLGSTDSPEQAAAQCSKFTQDAKVFAVVLDGGLQSSAVPCYAAANTLVLDETLVAHDTTQFQKYSPYLWSPTHPEYTSFVKAELSAMNDAKFFDGNTGVLLMPSDDEVSRRTTDTVVKPYLTSIGVTKMQTSYVDSTNVGTLGATSSAALVAGKNGKLNRVVVIGGARIEPVVLSDTNANNFPSTWSVSTYDSPNFTQDNPDSIVTALRLGMTGIGYAPAQDVDQNQAPAFPDPNNQYQQKCVQIMSAAGGTPPGNLRANWRTALQYCDGAMFLKAVLDNAAGTDQVTGQQFVDAAGKITGKYGSSLVFGSSWGPGIFAGTNTGETLSWDEPCLCFKYTSAVRTFGPVAAGGSAPTASVPGATPTPSSTSSIGTVPSTPASSAGTIDPFATITAYTQ